MLYDPLRAEYWANHLTIGHTDVQMAAEYTKWKYCETSSDTVAILLNYITLSQKFNYLVSVTMFLFCLKEEFEIGKIKPITLLVVSLKVTKDEIHNTNI